MSDELAKDAERIKERLRGARDQETVHMIANEERAIVQKIAANPETKVLAVHISNLKRYMLEVEVPIMEKRRNS